jgi:hypothetical protein
VSATDHPARLRAAQALPPTVRAALLAALRAQAEAEAVAYDGTGRRYDGERLAGAWRPLADLLRAHLPGGASGWSRGELAELREALSAQE